MFIPAGADTSLKIRVFSGTSASVAVLVTTSVCSSLIVWFGGTVRTGALFTSLTTTEKLPVSLKGGEPLSRTRTVMRLVLGRCASMGVQVSTPLPGSRITPSGADTRLKVNVPAGTSGSVAVLVTTSVASAWIALFGGIVSTGALFTSLTTTVKLLVLLRAGRPSSVTFTVIRLVLGPWVSPGVQVSTPLLESRVIPAGADTRSKIIVLAGMSGSTAVLVSTKVVSSLIVWFGGTVSTGALFSSLTTTVKLLV